MSIEPSSHGTVKVGIVIALLTCFLDRGLKTNLDTPLVLIGIPGLLFPSIDCMDGIYEFLEVLDVDAVAQQMIPDELRGARFETIRKGGRFVIEVMPLRVKGITDVHKTVPRAVNTEKALSGHEKQFDGLIAKKEAFSEPSRCDRIAIRPFVGDNTSLRRRSWTNATIFVGTTD